MCTPICYDPTTSHSREWARVFKVFYMLVYIEFVVCMYKRNAFFQVLVSTIKLCVCVCVEAYPCLTTFFKNVITKMVKKGVTI